MAAVTICSDFGAPQNKVCHCFHIYLPWSDGTRCHDLSFLNAELYANFFTLLFLLIYYVHIFKTFSSVQSLSHLALCNSMDCSTPGFPVHHQLLEFAQTHAHWVGDAIQPSHPVIPFSSCLQSFPASESFPMTQFFASFKTLCHSFYSVLTSSELTVLKLLCWKCWKMEWLFV